MHLPLLMIDQPPKKNFRKILTLSSNKPKQASLAMPTQKNDERINVQQTLKRKKFVHQKTARDNQNYGQPKLNQSPFIQVSANENNDCRISKKLSQLEICSRREADEWIKQGWVKVDGHVATLGQKVQPHQTIDIDKIARKQQAQTVTIVLNKPSGFVSGQPEDGHPTALSLITADNQWRDAQSFRAFSPLKGLAPAGRLDVNSTGLIVYTQDGRIAKQLIGSESLVEKEYLVRVSEGNIINNVAKHISDERIQKLRYGLSLDGIKLKPAKVYWQNGEQLRFILQEGRKRQIRRMCELIGLEVIGLKRIRVGQVLLGHLPLGQWRYLNAQEIF